MSSDDNYGDVERVSVSVRKRRGAKATSGVAVDERRSPSYDGEQAAENSEVALAEEFTKDNPHWRFVCKWGSWFGWDPEGGVWRPDEKLEIFDLARLIVERHSAELVQQKDLRLARSVASGKTIGAIERIARAEPKHAATSEQWDTNDWELNTPGGVYDLRTGARRAHHLESYWTKVTSVAPAPTVPQDCLWSRFVSRICWDNDQARYLKRIAGYTITGSTREECFFFLHGPGANGKSKLLGAIAGALGNYHQTAAIETFTEQKFAQHPADLAQLRGARFVTAVETEAGRRWAEAKIKSITGGDAISARFMRQDFFTFQPRLKLWIAGNHRPSLRNVDEAIRRRIHVIPFEQIIPPDERDLGLAAKLRDEWPIILRWCIDGCREWLEEGLNPPQRIVDATQAYLSDEDTFAQWLDDQCTVEPSRHSNFADLWDSWRTWAERSGERAGSKKRLGQTLQDRGFVAEHTRSGRIYKGLETYAAISLRTP